VKFLFFPAKIPQTIKNFIFLKKITQYRLKKILA